MYHVFISYVRDNIEQVTRLAADLHTYNVEVWLDRERVMPGQRWRDAIKSAIRDGALFVACFSKEYALRERTYMNEELALAIEELRLRSAERLWFVPTILAGGEVPNRQITPTETLRDIQWVDLAADWSGGVRAIANAALLAAEATQGHDEGTPPNAPNRQRHQKRAAAILRALTRRKRPARSSGRKGLKVVDAVELGVIKTRSLIAELQDVRFELDRSLATASLDYESNAYGAFWDTIEQCAIALSRSRNLLQMIAAYAETVHLTTPVPDLRAQYRRFIELVANAQRNFHFAVIWEQRRTRATPESGTVAIFGALQSLNLEMQQAYARIHGAS